MKISDACTGMLSGDNDAFKNQKSEKHIHFIHNVHYSSLTSKTALLISLALSVINQKHKWKDSRRGVIIYFPKYRHLILVTFHCH